MTTETINSSVTMEMTSHSPPPITGAHPVSQAPPPGNKPPVPPPKPTVLPLLTTTTTNGSLDTERANHGAAHKAKATPPLLKPLSGAGGSHGAGSASVGAGSGPAGAGSAGEEASWKERCQTLEASLHKFKQQASRIRELLSQKMTEHEERTEEAEKKWRESEKKVMDLEVRLSALSRPDDNNDDKNNLLEKEVREKDKLILCLQTDLQQQKSLRSAEARLVEEKSARIKDWVSKKIKEHEHQVGEMREENRSLHTQIEILRLRLQCLPAPAAREIHRRSIQEADSRPESTDIHPPAIPKRPSSSILESFRRERQLEELGLDLHSTPAEAVPHDLGHVQMDLSPEIDVVESMDNDDDVTDDLEPLYQEIDYNNESKYAPKRTKSNAATAADRMVPPQVRIERKVFPNPHLHHTASLASSTAGSEERLPYRMMNTPGMMSDSLEMTSSSETPIPSSPQNTQTTPLHDNYSTSSPTTTTTTTTTPPPATPPPTSNIDEYTYSIPHSTHMVSALATMPRRKKDNKIQINVSTTRDRNLPGTKDDSSTIPQETARGMGLHQMKPPTPPMRRLPSWENRIYAIANAGLKVPDVSNGLNRESCFPVTDGLYTDHMYQDLSVPVYTTLKGKAAQIRSTPFTGESSTDSSDNDDHVGVPMATGDKDVTSSGPGSSKAMTCVTKRRQVKEATSGATKRGVTSHSIMSVGSETSSDYALPPDEVSIQTDSSDNSEPEQKLLKYTTELFKKDSLERCGWLTKLGGKVKNWKRRWFVLKNGELLHYKSPNDVARKPQGYITLDGQTRVTKTEGALTFEITTAKRTYYLTADSKEDMDHWIRVLQNVLKKQAADRVLGQTHAKEVTKGWIIKTKHGRCRRCWCVLMGKFFMYYKRPSDKTPLGQIHLRDARIEEVDRSCDSETDSDDTAIPDYTLGIWPTCGGGPTYLMLPTKHEKDTWLYHLTVAAGGGAGNLGTEYEQILSKLMEADGDPTSVYWKHPVLLYTKEGVSKPLTTLPSVDLQEKALDLFKSCHMFTGMSIDSQQIDYHVALAQTTLELCLQHPEIQNELYCQLIKQTSRHPPQHKTGVQNLLLCGSHSWFLCDASPTSPTNSVMDLSESKLNPVNYVIMQGWQLLAMSISHFLPKQSILWYLKAHLHRNADPRTEIGKLAIFCQRALERSLHSGSREARPSRMEVMSILLRNPYHHSQPISIPVHFLNTTYQVVSFDGSTTVQEFLATLNKMIGMRDCALSGFSLFTDDPAGQELEHCLKGHLKICDVISKWEQAFLHHHSKRGRPDTSRTVKLTYKNRMYFKSLVRTETEKERLLLVYQVNDDIVNGRFPLNRDLAVELAALLAQIEYGDLCKSNMNELHGSNITLPQTAQQVQLVVTKFYPKRYRDGLPSEIKLIEQRVAEKWNALHGRSIQDCVRIYLTVARKWPFFGAKLFSARVKFSESGQVWLAVQEDSISILEYTTLKLLETYDYTRVVTFGGCRDDFMLVVSVTSPGATGLMKTDRLLFLMTKPKILEVTMLMASYINTRGQHKSVATSRGDVTKSRVLSLSSTSQHVTMELS